jgi:hypothetical protein
MNILLKNQRSHKISKNLITKPSKSEHCNTEHRELDPHANKPNSTKDPKREDKKKNGKHSYVPADAKIEDKSTLT